MKLSAIVSIVLGSITLSLTTLHLFIQKLESLSTSSALTLLSLLAISGFSIIVLLGVYLNKIWGIMAFLCQITLGVGIILIHRFNENGYFMPIDLFFMAVCVAMNIFIGFVVFDLKEENIWSDGEFSQ